MPIFMDRHDIPGVTARDVAEAHQEDLKIQEDFNCRALTYWFDEEKGMAFCLIEAPDEQAVQDLHNYAHGLIPNQIIEVEPNIVESFLGRIEDPADESDAEAVHDPAFRCIMIVHLESIDLKPLAHSYSKNSTGDVKHFLSKKLKEFSGREVEQGDGCFMASFQSVHKAFDCARAIVEKINSKPLNGDELSAINAKIGLSAGVPVTGDSPFFSKSVELARHMVMISKPGQIILSSKVSGMINNSRSISGNESIVSLDPAAEMFLSRSMEVLEKHACDPQFDVTSFCQKMGMSKSKLYRKSTKNIGCSPNDFIKEIRLQKALKLIREKAGNISEIAYACGFGSLSYFSKCFVERFKTQPSQYASSPL